MPNLHATAVAIHRWSRRAPALLLIVNAACAQEPSALAIVGVTLIDGTGASPVAGATVIIEDGIITCAGHSAECELPEQVRIIDAAGKWVTPGLIDAHVHFSQSGWIDSRPLTANLPVDERYDAAIDDLRRRPERVLNSLLCSGITAVADVGGYAWTTELAERTEANPLAPRVSAAGPLLTFIDYPLVYRGERQLVNLGDSAQVRSTVAAIADLQPDYIKLWYIVNPDRSGVDSTTAQHLAQLAALEIEARGLRLIVHATGLWEAKHAVRIGADVLVHSVFNDPVDDEFLQLASESGVIYTPTIMVNEGYVYMRLGMFARDRHDLGCADPKVVKSWGDWAKLETRADEATRNAALQRMSQRQSIALENLRRVHEAGITVALGTDSGNPMTLHGSAILRELELMRKAGLSSMEVIVSATKNAALVMGRGEDLGTVEAGKLGDLLVLNADPITDLSAFDEIEWVIRGGVAHPRDDLRPQSGS